MRLYELAVEHGGDSYTLRLNASLLRFQYGKHLLATGSATEAIVEFRAAIEEFDPLVDVDAPQSDAQKCRRDALIELSRALLRDGQHGPAAAIAQRVLEETPAAHNPPQWAAPLFLACYQFAAANDPTEATRRDYARRTLQCVDSGLKSTEVLNPGHPMNTLIVARLLHVRASVHRGEGRTWRRRRSPTV